MLTRAQSREIDRLAIERLGIPGVVLMENAGVNATDVATGMLEAVGGNKVAIVCGGGNNGGDGFVIARHLYIAGRTVVVYLAADPARLSGDAAINCRVCQSMGLKMMRIDDAPSLSEQAGHWSAADLVIDALLGTGFDASRGLGEHASAVIRAINDAADAQREGGRRPLVLAVDVPSGLDCDSGVAAQPTVLADATVTFVARKAGFEADEAQACLGEVFVVGIGTPPKLLEEAIRAEG